MEISLKDRATIAFGAIVIMGIAGVTGLRFDDNLMIFWASVTVSLLILVATQYHSKKTINELNKKIDELKPNTNVNVNFEQIENKIVNELHAENRKKFAIYSQTKNLQLQLIELKLSLITNRQQIKKNVLLKNDYETIISKIEFGIKEIENEINKD